VNAVILWKEYRQQRAVWLAILILAVLLVVILAEILGKGSGLQVYRDERLRSTLLTVVLCLVVAQGMVSGALLLASEKEDGTLVFLDNLTGKRGPIWISKCAAGVFLTLSQGLVLAGLAVGMGFGSWQVVIFFPLVALEALAWGLLGGALCRTVLSAVFAGIVFMAGSWLVAFITGDMVFLILAQTGATLVAGGASWQVFCRDDRLRRPGQTRIRRKLVLPVPADCRVLVWLAMRQGRWVLAGGLAGALVLGFTVNGAGLVLWPIGTLLLGLACGLTAFAPDQNEGKRFLGAQRFPAGTVWTVKILFWAAAAFVLTGLAWLVAVLFLSATDPSGTPQAHPAEPSRWLTRWLSKREELADIIKPALFLGLWPLYGFCFGQFFGQLTRRPVIALMLAVFITPLIVAMWVPSLLLGGLPGWQVVVVPGILLLTTRLVQWPWVSERLLTARPMMGIATATALMVIVMVGCLWFRAAEVPDVGEPFDVQAFIRSLPPPEKNKAGDLIRRAGGAMREHRAKVEKELGSPAKEASSGIVGEADEKPSARESYAQFVDMVLQNGWPNRRRENEFGHWLDRLFEGEWATDVQKAAPMPLGMVQDPRLTDTHDQRALGTLCENCRQLGVLFTARALQLQAHGDPRGSLDHLATVLALSRHVKNFAPPMLLYAGQSTEDSALSGFHLWLQHLGPDRKLALAGLEMLQKHEAAIPDPANTIKVEYVIMRQSRPIFFQGPQLVDALERVAYQVPWEKERQDRIARAVFQGRLREIQKPYWQTALVRWRNKGADRLVREAVEAGLPPEEGPGSNVSARQWSDWIRQFSVCFPVHFWIGPSVRMRSQQSLHAAELVTAVVLYQADHGSPPATLDKLVPTYLPAMPLDPLVGQPFGYRIVEGEGEVIENGHDPRMLAPGQAVISSSSLGDLPVPVWSK
jgi:hypothetical protein